MKDNERVKEILNKMNKFVEENPPFIELKINNHLDATISAILFSAILSERGIPHVIKRTIDTGRLPYFPYFRIEAEQDLLSSETKKNIIEFHYFQKGIDKKEDEVKEQEIVILEETGFIPPDDITYSLLTYKAFQQELTDPRFRLLALLSSLGAPVFIRRDLFGFTEKVMSELETASVIQVKKGIIFPCREGFDLHASLALVLEPQLDGLSLNEETCLDVFIKAGIPTRDGEEWRNPASLDTEELMLLNDKIIEFYSLSKALRFPKTLLRDQIIDMNNVFACSTLNDLIKIAWSLLHREDNASLFKFLVGEQQTWIKRGQEILKEDLLFYATKVKEVTSTDLKLFEGVYGFEFNEIISYENFYVLCIFVGETILSSNDILIGISAKPERHAVIIGSIEGTERVKRLAGILKTKDSVLTRISKFSWVLTSIRENALNALTETET